MISKIQQVQVILFLLSSNYSFVITSSSTSSFLPVEVRIGGLFLSSTELEQQLILHAAIERINNVYNRTLFLAQIKTLEDQNSQIYRQLGHHRPYNTFISNAKSK